MFRKLTVSVCALGIFISFVCTDDQIFHVPLDEDGSITLDWTLDYIHKFVTFEVHVPSDFGWFVIGFSDRGELFPADYCVLWYDWRRRLQFKDASANEEGVLFLDRQQDCLHFRSKRRGTITKFTYRRAFDTCDTDDYIIEDGTTHIVWSKGNDRLYHLEGLNISSTDGNNGMVRVQLLKNTNVRSNVPPNAKVLEILADKVHVPADETTYWCHVHKISDEFKEKHHIVQEGNEGLVHHMEVFHCVASTNEDIPLYAGSCFAPDRPESTKVCKRVIAAWAMGAKAFVYPEEAGLPIGGADFNPYLMLEAHYNNPAKKMVCIVGMVRDMYGETISRDPRHASDWIDSSGVKFHIISKLRPMDAGVIELGLEYTDKMAIPPGQESFPLTGYCVSECTAVSLPPDGIVIFGSQLHTHLSGIRALTRHIRNGRELPELNRDDHYSTHFQEIRRLKRTVNVLPVDSRLKPATYVRAKMRIVRFVSGLTPTPGDGDALITTCDYSTSDRKNVTLGGFAISDEMCVNYIHYFPAASLEVCKSAVSDQALSTYFQFMHEWENQKTSPENGISDNYKVIEWNRMRIELLKNVYHEAPLSMQCNMSSGDRFPGYWENTPITPVLSPLPPPARECDN